MAASLETPPSSTARPNIEPRQRQRPLHVAMLIHRFFPHVGGAESQLQALIPHLRSSGVEVQVITRREPGTRPLERIQGVSVLRTNVPRQRAAASLAYTVEALRYLAQAGGSVDVIHAHGLLSPTTTAVLAKLLLRRPVVATAHGYQADLALLRSGFLGSQRIAVFAAMVDRFVVISREIGEGLEQVGVPPRKLTAISNGIDVAEYCPATPQQKHAARTQLALADGPIVVYVGRLEPVKGPRHLMDAWATVRKQVPSAELVIVGDGSERESLQTRALSGVRLVGAQANPVPYYHAADCFVLPSYSEGLPVALLEALAVGLPVVSTAVGGSPEILRGFETECLVPAGDVEALSTALVRTITTPPNAARIDELRERITRDYSIEHTARRLASLYAELAAEGSPQ